MKTCLVLCLALTLGLAGCDAPESGRRLHLPSGNADRGKAAFIALQCTECHTVSGVDLPKPTVAAELVVELGGSVPRLRTVGDLLTSIIHPTQGVTFKNRRPAAMNMPVVNDTMTVTQMIDLVRFLQPRYSEMAPPLDMYYSL